MEEDEKLRKLAQLHRFTLSEIDACAIGMKSRDAEIESMKCCGNCGETMGCKYGTSGFNVCDEWEGK